MLRDRYFKLGAKLGLRPSNYDIKSVVENVLLLNDIEFNKDLAEKLRDSLYFIPKVAKGFHNKSHLEQIRMLYQIWRVKSISTPRSLFSIEDLYHFWRSSSWRTSLTNFDAKGLVILSNENSSWEKYELPFPKNVFYAKIITIQSRTSISGLVTPIALIDARSIFGEGLMQADLIDFDNVLRLDIRERDLAQVHIQSGGKVTVVDIVSDARVDNALVIKTPTHCSSCNHKLEIISNALRRCPNTQYCPEQIVKRFRAQISDILYPSINLITDSFIHNLIFEHQINTPERLLELSDEDLKELANTNGSSMIRILDSAVKKARKNPNQVSLPMHLKIFVSGELSDSERELLEDLSNKTGLRVSETLDSSLDAVLVARQSDTKHISQARRLQVPLTSIDELVDHVKLIL